MSSPKQKYESESDHFSPYRADGKLVGWDDRCCVLVVVCLLLLDSMASSV